MKLSIIVCTRNRANALRPCLDSIDAALAAAGPLEAEMVIVDNGSSDGTAEAVRVWSASVGRPVNLVFEPAKGLSRARNRALAVSRGELLAFTDDDCQLERPYVADLLRHYAADTEPVARGGPRRLGDSADLPFCIYESQVPYAWPPRDRASLRRGLEGLIVGANMVMPRTLTDRIGLFDVRLGAGAPIPSGEDTDYLYRAWLAGMRIEYVPDMAVRHHHGRRTVAEARDLYAGYWRGRGALLMKHLFSDIELWRPVAYDAKRALIELLRARRDSLPVTGHSSREKLYWDLRGALDWLRVAAQPAT